MAVAFRAEASGTKTASSGLNLVINVPAGTTDGDVMIAVVACGSAVAAPSQASWTTLDTQTAGPTVRSFMRIASSEPASYTFTVADAQGAVGFIVTYSGTDPTTPVDQHSAWNRLTSTTNVSGTTVTPSVNNCMILFAGAMGAAASTTPPAGYTERSDHASPGGQVVECAELLQTTASATGTVTATSSASTNTQGTVIALKPAAVVAAGRLFPLQALPTLETDRPAVSRLLRPALTPTSSKTAAQATATASVQSPTVSAVAVVITRPLRAQHRPELPTRRAPSVFGASPTPTVSKTAAQVTALVTVVAPAAAASTNAAQAAATATVATPTAAANVNSAQASATAAVQPPPATAAATATQATATATVTSPTTAHTRNGAAATATVTITAPSTITASVSAPQVVAAAAVAAPSTGRQEYAVQASAVATINAPTVAHTAAIKARVLGAVTANSRVAGRVKPATAARTKVS